MASPSGACRMQPSTTSSTRSVEDLWEKALDRLQADDKVLIQVANTNRLEVLGEVLLLVRAKELACQQKRWRWKNRKGETVIVRDVFTKMIIWIEKFKSVGDTIVQYDPGHAALPWAAARIILQAAVNDAQTNGAMADGLELVFNLIAKFEVVERLYLSQQYSLHTKLVESIVTLYTATLEYLVQAQRYYSQRTSVRIFKSIIQLEELTTKHTTDIKFKANAVEEYIRLISGEIIYSTENRLYQVDGRLATLDVRLKKLDTIDSRSEQFQTSLDDEHRELKKIWNELHEPIARFASQLSDLNDKLKETDRLKVFDWLSQIPYTSHHRSKVKALLPGSGEWLLKKPEFIEWMSTSSSSILWLHGIPGSGKSMLVAHVIEYIKRRTTGEIDGTLAYFYCARNANEPERSEPVEVFRSIIEQLSCSAEDSPIRLPVVREYLARKKDSRGRQPDKLDLEDCVKIILDLLEENPATVVLDGLDECDPTRRQDLLEALHTIIRDSQNVVKVFLSSRDDHDLVHRLSETPNLYIEAADNMDDIRKFVFSSVDEAIRKEKIICGNVPESLRSDITSTLISQSNGMFRLVSLHIQSLCNPERVKTKANVLDSLKNLPVDLKRSYDDILSQIRNTQYPNPMLAERVLKWLLCAKEPLRSKIFLIAVCSDTGNSDLLRLSDILSICCNLVIYDRETDLFRFAHLSVREHLEGLSGYSIMEVNSLAAEQCISWFFTTEKCRTDWSHVIGSEEILEELDILPFCNEIRAGHLCLSDLRAFQKHADTNWPTYAQLAGRMREQGRLKNIFRAFLLFEFLVPQREGAAFEAWICRTLEDNGREIEIAGSFWDRSGDPLTYYNRKKDYVTKFYFENLTLDPLFVACTFNFTEVVSYLTRATSWDIVCGHATVVYNNHESLGVILNSIGTQALISLAVDAAALGHVEALQEILSKVEPTAFTSDDLWRVVKETLLRRILPEEYALKILFQRNPELQITQRILELIFEFDFEDAATLSVLLKFSDFVELTERLVTLAYQNTMENNPFSSTGHPVFEKMLKSSVPLYISPSVISKIFSLDRSAWTLLVLGRWPALTVEMEKQIGSRTMPRMHLIRDLIRSRTEDAATLSIAVDILMVLMQPMDKPLSIGREEMYSVVRGRKDRKDLQALLQLGSQMTEGALLTLVASADLEVMEMVLGFRSIKVTNSIIRAAAGNFKHGEQIMHLLLEREMEVEA